MVEKKHYVNIIDSRHSETTSGNDSKYMLVTDDGQIVGVPRPQRGKKSKTLSCIAVGVNYTFTQTAPGLNPVINPLSGKINFEPGSKAVSFTGKLRRIHDPRLQTTDGDTIFIAELDIRGGIAFFAFALNHFAVSSASLQKHRGK